MCIKHTFLIFLRTVIFFKVSKFVNEIQLTFVISNIDNSNFCLIQTKFWIMLVYFCFLFITFELKLLLSQTENACSLEFEIIRVHCTYISKDGMNMYLAEAVLTSTHNLCFEQKHEKYSFYLKIFSFWR